jgi:hypothetical protein
MKKKLFLIVLSCSSLFAQTNFKNVIPITEKEFYEKDFEGCPDAYRKSVRDIKCEDFKCTGKVMEFTFSNLSPESTDLEKVEIRKAIENEVALLISIAKCSNSSIFLISLGEGIFIDEKDNLPYESNAFRNKAAKLNLSRFVAKHGKALSEAFLNQTIYIMNWGW